MTLWPSIVLSNPVPEPAPDVTLVIPEPNLGAGANPTLVGGETTASVLGVGKDGKTTWKFSNGESVGGCLIQRVSSSGPFTDIPGTATAVVDASNFILAPAISTITTQGVVVTASVSGSCGLGSNGNYNCVLGVGGGNGVNVKLTTMVSPTSIVYKGTTDVPVRNGGQSGVAVNGQTVSAIVLSLVSAFALGFLMV